MLNLKDTQCATVPPTANLILSDEGATNGVNEHSKTKSIDTNGKVAQNSSNSGPSPLRFYSTSYPSNCLQFLQGMNPAAPAVTAHLDSSQAKLKLNVIVVGAGLGGLATAVALTRRGHQVTVLEQAPKLAEVGAGIQIPPNSGKLLQRWGVIDELGEQAVRPDGISFRRWSSGDVIGFTDLSASFARSSGAPYYVAHRAHLHSALLRRAECLGVIILPGSRVVSYEPTLPSVTLSDGRVLEGDLVVAADGIKSIARNHVCHETRSKPKATGYAVYRATVDVRKIREIPEALWLIEKPGLNIWIGEDRHVMTYTIAAGESFNMVLSHKDPRDPSTWQEMTQEDMVREMRQQFNGWDAVLLQVINLIDHTLKWPLIGNNYLSTWTSPSSRLVVLGDAAHAMVPYMSQGAAMAVEDGAALAVAINNIRSIDELKFALNVFQSERRSRTSMMQEASMVNSMIWHFADGPEQRERDAAMQPEVQGRSFQSSPNQWSDPLTQSWAYGYDAERKMEEEWELAVHQAILAAMGSS